MTSGKDIPDRPSRRAKACNQGNPGTERGAVIVFPFDLFGSTGAGGGAELIADELREIFADNRRERTPTRARAYSARVRVHQVSFETLTAYATWREQGRCLARRALDRGEFLVWITGNHLGALPVYDELGAETTVLQLDAHLDIHDFTDCTRELSHGNFLRHCAGPLPAIVNVGHRELLLLSEEIRGYFQEVHPAEALAVEPKRVLSRLRQTVRPAKRVFLDIDCDVFDPAFFPAVTHPVPFGLSSHHVLALIDAVWSKRVIGLALSEFDPSRDREDQSLAMIMWLIERIMLKRFETAGTSDA